MDLNELLRQQQVALIGAALAVRNPRAGSRFDLVEHYGRRIRRVREELGVSQYPDWAAETVLPRA